VYRSPAPKPDALRNLHSRLVYEVEEPAWERTREVRIEVSEDGGRRYRQILVQKYNFSLRGATYQREELRFNLHGVPNFV
jgi:hypothetical protein